MCCGRICKWKGVSGMPRLTCQHPLFRCEGLLWCFLILTTVCVQRHWHPLLCSRDSTKETVFQDQGAKARQQVPFFPPRPPLRSSSVNDLILLVRIACGLALQSASCHFWCLFYCFVPARVVILHKLW